MHVLVDFLPFYITSFPQKVEEINLISRDQRQVQRLA